MEKEVDKEFFDLLCIIEVSGIKDMIFKDFVEFYFDSKKLGGGGVEEVKGEVKDGVIVIIFENEDSKWISVWYEILCIFVFVL